MICINGSIPKPITPVNVEECETSLIAATTVSPEELERYKRQCRRSWIQQVGHEVSLLSPWLWIGMAKARRISWAPLWRSFQCIVIPIVSYQFVLRLITSEWVTSRTSVAATDHTVVSSSSIPIQCRHRLPALRSLIWPWYLLSPWTLYHLFQGFRPMVQTAAQMFAFRFTLRSTTLDEATVTLGQRIERARAYRRLHYDLYVPATKTATALGEISILLLIPGAGVESTAYAIPASMISDDDTEAFYVVVLNTESTLRLTSRYMGYSSTRNIQEIQRDVIQQISKVNTNTASVSSYRWYAAGHSMGCFALSHLDLETVSISKVVFWGLAPFVSELNDLSSFDHVSVLLIQGTQDELIRMIETASSVAASSSSPKEFQQLPPDLTLSKQMESKLPRHTSEINRIFGGTHCGFASYKSAFGLEDQDTRSRSDQQRQVVEQTLRFLRHRC